MAVTYDNATGIAQQYSSSRTISHTCSGSDRVLVVFVLRWYGGSISSVTYAGVAMTFLGSFDQGNYYLDAYKLIGPATGANNVVITFSGTLQNTGTIMSFNGANDINNLAFEDAYSKSLTVTSANGNMVADMRFCDQSPTADAGQTVRVTMNSGEIQSSTKPSTSSSTTMTWTQSRLITMHAGVNIVAGAQSTEYTLSLTDTVSISASLLKQSQRTFFQAVAVSSSMIKAPGKVMSQSISLVSSMIRDSFITFSQAISISSTFIRGINRQFSEAIAISDAIEKINIYFKALSETIAISAQFIIQQTVKAFNEAISVYGNMLISSFKTLAESLAVIDSFIKASGKVLSEAVAISSNMIKQAYLTISETISLVASFLSSASLYKTFSEALSVADSALRAVGRVLSERVAISASVVKNMVRTLSETVSVVSAMLRMRSKEYGETITVIDTLSKLIGRTLQESLSLVSKLIIKLNGFVTNFWGRGRRNEGSWGKGGRNIGDWTRKNRN